MVLVHGQPAIEISFGIDNDWWIIGIGITRAEIGICRTKLVEVVPDA